MQATIGEKILAEHMFDEKKCLQNIRNFYKLIRKPKVRLNILTDTLSKSIYKYQLVT